MSEWKIVSEYMKHDGHVSLELYREGQEVEIKPDTILPMRVMKEIVEDANLLENNPGLNKMKHVVHIKKWE